ncbi:AAA family ATPase [Nonlabens xiamenensis]|uniref:AAA family ATPase n=1 Tax=Nonlabens xiamenensis TaxID=2341043 RepID=UPI000F60ECA5|nr:AAA family ATPase [Nonlabens xiamenensis]
MKKIQRILIMGGPGSGKTTLLKAIESAGHHVHHEISREVTARAQEKGIQQLFLEDPMAFSNELLAGRIEQFKNPVPGLNFYDRGIPDVPAYHLFTGDDIPQEYVNACMLYTYDQVFFLPPWEEIYQSDAERYEDCEQAVELGDILVRYYTDLGYKPITVPKTNVEQRLTFIKEQLDY